MRYEAEIAELFSTTSGNITEDVVMAYLDRHIAKQGFSPTT